MALVTIQVIQGHEAGIVLRDLETPFTIGREEENEVQLNDERISRFHAKVQGNDDALILTDLDSTNGTRVNGHYTKMRMIQLGDQIAVGRCLLIVGNPSEINIAGAGVPVDADDDSSVFLEDNELVQPAFPGGPPECPADLNALQAAQVASLVEFARTEVLAALNSISSRRKSDAGQNDEQISEDVVLPPDAWHRLQSVPGVLARYLTELANPSDE
ncbi:Oxoglutarate dehydrogenase inhibitor [Thalassoglobus neptunius]|uniref:Oxoglutarate dehydrogenase inhibitor n=1 Tax=Thalassoglobus neptunius TaxID=1938619 RepID=A0A5C5WQG6_9PLAN|nr:FHA domain-containing protein [Thalassoglobus neptunius]TWT52032.1 Oxoglutarate dehydrogenase inhibitor [Thalassoglobus neptunius]